jgi:hypothetical protein
MSPTQIEEQQRQQVERFLADMLGMEEEPPAPSPTTSGEYVPRFSAATSRRNQPEFWADAPWRLEPDGEVLPLTFIIRDADVQPPGRGPWRLYMLRVEQRLGDGTWYPVCSFVPADLPGVDAEGAIDANFWTFRTEIPLAGSDSDCHLRLDEVERGGPPLHLKVVFAGSFYPFDETESPEIHLESLLAVHPLPQGRAALPGAPRRWFYGDTHYHSAYTNDVKEFGGPVRDTRAAAQAIGLDWLVITDHSCDLDEADGEPGAEIRWERLKAEIASGEISDAVLRVILGEEITLRGGDGDRYLHMLAFGGLDEMIEGGFLPDEPDSFVTQLFKDGIERLLRRAAAEGGYAADIARRLFGPIRPFTDVLAVLPDETLAFAAHPYDVAQPPFVKGDWDDEDLIHLRLTGLEFWNGRTRRSARMTDDPFSASGWADPARLAQADAARIEKIRGRAEERWDPLLRRGVDSWLPAEDLPSMRPLLVAGSDAHGSFNYSVGWGWDYQKQMLVDDNALGRVRTAVYLPDHDTHTVPEVGDILAALRHGACVATDGPLVELSLSCAGQAASLGDAITLAAASDADLEITVHSTPEFGAATQVEVVHYLKDAPGSPGRTRPGWGSFLDAFLRWRPRPPAEPGGKTTVRAGETQVIPLEGSQGYLRVQAETTGADGERFLCLTNPIWLRIDGAGAARLHAHLEAAS